MTNKSTTSFNDEQRELAGDQLAEVPKPLSKPNFSKPLCDHNALKQYTLLNGEGSNLEAYQREIIPIAQLFFSSVRGWTSAFLLAVHRLCGVIEGRLSHFLPRWLRTGWQSAISQGKIP